MNFNNFTIKSQEAVQEAVNLVQSRGQQAIEPAHILHGVMKYCRRQPSILKKWEMNLFHWNIFCWLC